MSNGECVAFNLDCDFAAFDKRLRAAGRRYESQRTAGLAGADERYEEQVDIVWNLQPIPDGINNYKRARHPKKFFNSPDTARYWQDYDFIPEPQSPIWDDSVRHSIP
jgi:hypothetical protein